MSFWDVLKKKESGGRPEDPHGSRAAYAEREAKRLSTRRPRVNQDPPSPFK